MEGKRHTYKALIKDNGLPSGARTLQFKSLTVFSVDRSIPGRDTGPIGNFQLRCGACHSTEGGWARRRSSRSSPGRGNDRTSTQSRKTTRTSVPQSGSARSVLPAEREGTAPGLASQRDIRGCDQGYGRACRDSPRHAAQAPKQVFWALWYLMSFFNLALIFGCLCWLRAIETNKGLGTLSGAGRDASSEGPAYSIHSMHSRFGHAARDRLKGRLRNLILIPTCLLCGAIGVQADSSEDFEPRVSSARTGDGGGGAQTSAPVLSGGEESRVKPNAALSKDGTVRIGRKGMRIRSGGGAFKAEMHLRSQIRFSTPFASAPRRHGDFVRTSDRDLRFRRARFKARGEVFRPWIRFNTEYDLVGTRLLDGNVTIQKWAWLQFRFGQWKTEYGRERVDSSGRQEFADRSIVNRQFTADRQKGIQVLGRLKEGTLADSRYYAGVFSGNGRGFRESGAGRLDNRDGSPMWAARYQWNFLREDPGYSQTDVEYHDSPVAAVAVSALSNRSRFTRFSGSGGGRLDGFEVGLPGQFAVKQLAEDFVLKYRGLFLQHEFHWKHVRDRVHHRITRMRGATLQGGYFPHHIASWVPRELELGLRVAAVDPDRARQYDRVTESSFVVNWFLEGHDNKLTFDVGRFGLAQADGADQSSIQLRVQWDVSF